MQISSLAGSVALHFLKRRSSFGKREHVPRIEPLEPRIAPATLALDHLSVTYQDVGGDGVTIALSQPLFDPAKIDQILKFDIGSVDGINSARQQLQLIDLTRIASAGVSLSVTITGAMGDGHVDVGFIKATGRDLNTVTVEGDLGRIGVGDSKAGTPGLNVLAVESIGARGTLTQKSGGTLVTRIQGALGALNVGGDIQAASVSVFGGADATIGSVTVGGSLLGGAAALSGVIRSTGDMLGPVDIGGNIAGGAGAASGTVGTGGALGGIHVGGSLTGGAGTGSGSILSKLAMGAVSIDGDIQGGAGVKSGVVGTGGVLGSVTLGGTLMGGGKTLSGAILSKGDMGPVVIGVDVLGGLGKDTGVIGTSGKLTSVHVFDDVLGGAGEGSGSIRSRGDMGTVTIDGDFTGGPGKKSGAIGTSGELAGVMIGGKMSAGGAILSAGDMGVVAAGAGFDHAEVLSRGDIAGIASGPAGAITGSAFVAGMLKAGPDKVFGTLDDATLAGSRLGMVSAGDGIAGGFFLSGSFGNISSGGPLAGVTFLAKDGTATGTGIGDISVAFSVGALKTVGMSDVTFDSPMSIGNVAVTLGGANPGSAVVGMFDTSLLAGTSVGNVQAHINVSGSNDSRGIHLSNVRAGLAGGIGGIGQISAALSGHTPSGTTAAIEFSTFDAGAGDIARITASANDNKAISLGTFRAGGDIGSITVSAGVTGTAAISDTLISALGDIGDVAVTGSVLQTRLLAGYDVGSDPKFTERSRLTPAAVAKAAGASVGNVSISGQFLFSDIVASVDPGPGMDPVFGDDDDTNVSDASGVVGGRIGTIDLSTGITPTVVLADQPGPHAIEAAFIADLDPIAAGLQVRFGGIVRAAPLVFDGDRGGTVTEQDARVRIL